MRKGQTTVPGSLMVARPWTRWRRVERSGIFYALLPGCVPDNWAFVTTNATGCRDHLVDLQRKSSIKSTLPEKTRTGVGR